MAARGLQDIPIRPPEEWSAAWYLKHIREVLALVDIRNAIEGPGITITGSSSEPATVSAAGGIVGLLDVPFVTLSLSSQLTAERILNGESGIVTITDGGAGNSVTVGLQDFGVPYSKLLEGPAFSVLGNQLDSSGPIAPITAANEYDVLWVRDIDGAGTLGMEFSYLRFADGSDASPGIAFYDDQDTGLFRIGSDNFGMSTDGVLRWDVDTTRVHQSLPLIMDLELISGELPALQVNRDGAPGGGFEVSLFDNVAPGDDTGVQVGLWEGGIGSYPPIVSGSGYRWRLHGDEAFLGDLVFYQHANSSSGVEVYRHARTVGAGTPGPPQMLFVDGSEASPPISFKNYRGSGMYVAGNENLRFSVAGTIKFQVASGAVYPHVPVHLLDGSASTPQLSFNLDPNTGLWRPGNDQIGFSTGGTNRLTLTTTALASSVPLHGAAGSAGAPMYSFSGDSNTGMYSVGADSLGFSTGNALRLTIDTSAFTGTLPWRGQDGSNTAPAFSFSGDTNTGRYRIGADNMGDVAGGVLQLEYGATYVIAKTQWRMDGVISPAQLTANADDWNPTNLGIASVIRFSTDASRDITGLQGGAPGREVYVINTGSSPGVLKHESASSSAENRFALASGTDTTLQPGGSAHLWYDATSSRWREINRVA